MTYEGTVQETPKNVPEGMYNAYPVSITRKDNNNDPYLIISFKIDSEDDYDGEKVTGICADKIHENTKWGKWIKAITGRLPIPGEKINSERDILNKPCLIRVIHTQKNEYTKFANVGSVLPKNINNEQETKFPIEE